MIQTVSATPKRALEFGIYRDGDNNLDAVQAVTLRQALQSSSTDSAIEYTVEDTTAVGSGVLHTDAFRVEDGHIASPKVGPAHDMSSAENLARFVAQTLDNAEQVGAKQTWIELTDHGAGDGGGLEADSTKRIMSMPAMADAIAQGVKIHAQDHPEDAGRRIDGVAANQCLMASLGFADSLSHAGVKYLAASPETMLAPGTPTAIADAIAKNETDPGAMGRAVVDTVMNFRYGHGGLTWGPAAAFDVLDVSAQKMRAVEVSVKSFNDAVASASTAYRADVRSDAAAVDGMVRFSEATADMPWHADRPAVAFYTSVAQDARLNTQLRAAAAGAADAVASTIIAHEEKQNFGPFGGADYADAVGPTVHVPVTHRQIDPWAPKVSETQNAFYKETDGALLAGALA
ncbi:MAG: hypothetical protein M3M96_08680 [Candidatus Eremiobacteraeota bacterium]|nr:hypothetical protein [Candidatus Eremiobacteraeota bacterium]